MKETQPQISAYIRLCAAASLLPLLLASTARALDAGPVMVHGSVSATASYSDTYNYLGDTRKALDLNLIDVVLNGTHRYDNGLRVGAQLYAYKIGGFSDITLDWANLDYSFTQAFGLRVGRNKVPLGLYNDSQDLDAVRTFASLPITFYPKTYRAISSSMDGLTLYGNIGLDRFGSLDYQIYAGFKEDIAADAPFVRGIDNLAQYGNWEAKQGLRGGSIFWNPPVEGLRVGYSYFESPENQLRGTLSQAGQMHGAPLGYVIAVDRAFGAGTWDRSGLFAGTPASTTDMRVVFHVFSAEYTWGKWVFAAEYKLHDVSDGVVFSPALARLGQPTSVAYTSAFEQYYGMITYQATTRVGLGLYYCHEDLARKNANSSSDPTNYTKDWAAAISYAAGDGWIFKLEGHLMGGRSQVWSAGDDNHASGTDKNWTYLVVKSTFSF